MRNRGFQSSDHARKFDAGRALVCRGGQLQAICGARTRSGAPCQSAPLKGHWRCLRHAGPKAARQLRDRQLRALALGKLSIAAFARLEARREANRLRRLWKRDPWVAGATVDLGGHEPAFAEAIGPRLSAFPPALSDWLRWKYRRFQLDTRDEQRWSAAVSEGVAMHAKTIGPRAGSDREAVLPQVARVPEVVSVVDVHSRLDQLAPLMRHKVGWLWQPSISELQRERALFDLVEMLERPEDAAAWLRWVETVRRLRA